MGGLVARYWIGCLEGWRYCAGLVTLGTPHRGAPKSLDWLVNGIRLGGVRQRRATDVLRRGAGGGGVGPGGWGGVGGRPPPAGAPGGRAPRLVRCPGPGARGVA